MSETWYKTTPTWSSAYQIYPVEIERHTDLSVFIKGRAQRKETTYECFYPTWESAKAAIVADKESKIHTARLALDRAISALDVAKKLTAPQRESKP